MTRLDIRVLGPALLLVMSVAGTSVAQVMEGPPPETMQESPQTVECPEFIRGSRLKVSNVRDGVALNLTTSNRENIPLLRQLTRDFVSAVEQHAEAQAKAADMDPDAKMPPLDMKTKDIDGGSQLIVRAENSEDVATIRREARDVEEAWQTSECVTGIPERDVVL